MVDNQKTPNFSGLFGVLFLILAGLIFINSGIFAIRNVTVKGNQLVPVEDILFAAHLNRYKNIFQVDTAKIQQEIVRNPQIASVKISRIFPNKIELLIKERRPVCLLLYLGNLLIIGEDSVLMGVKDENDPIDLPIVTGVQLKKAKIGGKVTGERFKTALKILKLADDDIGPMISEINPVNLQLYLDPPNSAHTVKVDLGADLALEKKIYNLRAILSHTSPDELEKIDLRVADLPTIIKLKKPIKNKP